MKDLTIDKILTEDLKKYIINNGIIKYPFPVEDFALKTFNLDIQYVDFNEEFKSDKINPKEIFGALFPTNHFFKKQERVVLINTNREPFFIGDLLIPNELYWNESERQTIAHEIGHFTHMQNFPNLFDGRKFDDAPSILLHVPKNEVFANKYARKLLMPENVVKSLKAKNEILGPVNLISEGKMFRNFFGVTQFMLETRFMELNIPFTNGIYMNKYQRSKGEKYSEDDLLTLANLMGEYNMNPNYNDCEKIAIMYNKLRNQDRDSGSLYFVTWRINNGYYDKFESVLELRLKLNTEIFNNFKVKITEE